MLRLPPRFAAIILTFAPLFLQRSWRHSAVLLTGAILAPGGRTVTSILRIAGMARGRGVGAPHHPATRSRFTLQQPQRRRQRAQQSIERVRIGVARQLRVERPRHAHMASVAAERVQARHAAHEPMRRPVRP